MSGLLYHQLLPENNAPSGFVQHNTIDFILKADGRKMIKNSIRLDFDLEGYTTFTTPGAPGNVRVALGSAVGLPHKIGVHSLVSECSTEIQSVGLIESLTDYDRMANIIVSASQKEEDCYTQRAQVEGRQPHVMGGRYCLQQVAPKVFPNAGGGTTDLTNKLVNAQYSLKPLIAFNRCVGDDYSFSKNGYIRISFTLNRSARALLGVANSATCGYVMSNVKLRFQSRPDDGKQGKMLMNTAVNLKSAANSQVANINARVPLRACSGVVVSYIRQSSEVSLQDDSIALQQFPLLDRIEYLFQDNNSKYYSYPIEDNNVMVAEGIKALSDSGFSQTSPARMRANDGVVHGLSFQQMLDMTKQKFSVQLQSSSNTIQADPVNVFLMFLGMIQV